MASLSHSPKKLVGFVGSPNFAGQFHWKCRRLYFSSGRVNNEPIWVCASVDVRWGKAHRVTNVHGPWTGGREILQSDLNTHLTFIYGKYCIDALANVSVAKAGLFTAAWARVNNQPHQVGDYALPCNGMGVTVFDPTIGHYNSPSSEQPWSQLSPRNGPYNFPRLYSLSTVFNRGDFLIQSWNCPVVYVFIIVRCISKEWNIFGRFLRSSTFPYCFILVGSLVFLISIDNPFFSFCPVIAVWNVPIVIARTGLLFSDRITSWTPVFLPSCCWARHIPYLVRWVS